MSAHFASPSGLAATGVTIAGVKYMYVSGEENTEIYVKKVHLLRCLHLFQHVIFVINVHATSLSNLLH